jgi:membrane-bound lytic murein transglycosylase D
MPFKASEHNRYFCFSLETMRMKIATRFNTLLVILLLMGATSSLQAQISMYYATGDSTYSYEQFWESQLDSLSNSWIVDFIETEVEVREGDDSWSLDTLYGLALNERAKSLYRFYMQNQPHSFHAVAMHNRYLPLFEQALQEQGLPQSLAALPFALSAMNNHTRSYTGGAGYWQLTYTIARKNQLVIESYVDQRLDVQLSSRAAAKYLKTLYSIYGDWKLTIAAYACGPTNVNKAIRRNDNSVNFYDIQASLPWFGKDIVDAFAASMHYLKISGKDIQCSYTQLHDTVEVSRHLHFIQLQDILGLNLDELRFLNPSFKHDIVPAIRKIYPLYLPQGNLARFNELEDSIYAYKDSILFQLQRKVVLPPPPAGRHWAKPTKAEVPEDSKLVYYTIKSGDNLGSIAARYGVKVSELEDWNNIYNPRRIQIGRKLKIYVPKNKKTPKNTQTTTADKAENPPKEGDLKSGEYFYHTVKSGESPYNIARKYDWVSPDDILKWNNISDARKIQVGQKLKIKKRP